ncbi:MAG: hypothetical protein JWM80_3325 [Cyanobacteria bacterium RYN_339]|nr:hypothetical protein [Cyanobacteria bacterium RYN_339]
MKAAQTPKLAVALLAVVVAACSSGAPSTKRVVATRASAGPGASAKPVVAVASPAVRPLPSPTATPDGRLAGTLAIDARYAVDVGAALLSDAGGGLVANNGGNILSNNGGGIISEHGGAFRLLAVAARPAVGTVLPVAGMQVTATLMTTGVVLGQPSFTDARGEFRLAVPDDQAGNVVLRAELPAAVSAALRGDRRLQYEDVTFLAKAERQEATRNPIDEDTAVIYRYLREDFGARLDDMLIRPDATELFKQIDRSLPGGGAILRAPLELMRAKARELGYVTLPAAKRLPAARQIADLALGDVDLGAVKTNVGGTGWDGATDELAVPIMIDTMRQVRLGATTKLAVDAHFFDGRPYITPGTAILRPSDLCDFVVRVLFAGSEPDAVVKLDPVLVDLGIDRKVRYHYTAASNGMIVTLGLNLVNKQDDILKALAAVTAS